MSSPPTVFDDRDPQSARPRVPAVSPLAGAEPDGRPGLRRWVRWYPLGVVALVGALWLLVPRSTPLDEPPARAPDARSSGSSALAPGVLERGRRASVDLERRARLALGSIAAATRDVAEQVEVEDLERGGLRLARLTPYAGPCLRYRAARAQYRDGDAEQRAAAKRRTVVALAELSLDLGSGGLARPGSGLVEALEGAVDVADFCDFALALHGELDEPYRVGALDALDARIEDLAGLALEEVAGLDALVEALLELEGGAWTETLPEDVAARTQELLRAFAPGDEGSR